MPGDALDRYAPSGRTGRSLAWALPAAVASSAAAGVGYQWVLDRNPMILLDIFLPVSFGLVIAATVVLALVLGHVRRRAVVLGVVVACTVSGLSAAWIAVLEGWTEYPVDPAAFAARMPITVRATAWVIEGAAVAVAAGLPAFTWWSRAVYSEADQRFLRRRFAGRAYGPTPLGLREAANAGLEAVAALDFRPGPGNRREGEFRYYVHEGCAGQSLWLTVMWHGMLDNPAGRPIKRDVLVLRRVVVERSVLARLLAKGLPAKGYENG